MYKNVNVGNQIGQDWIMFSEAVLTESNPIFKGNTNDLGKLCKYCTNGLVTSTISRTDVVST